MKVLNVFVIFIIVVFFGCNSKSSNLGSTIELSKDSISTVVFLEKMFDSINEPDLKFLPHECYRFTFLDSFGKNKLYRVDYFGDTSIRLVIKFYDTGVESEIFSVKFEETIDLTLAQYDEFKKLIEGSYFWSKRMLEKPQPMYLDGYGYLL